VSWQAVALLLGAGLVGGIANAIAGGATLITFPAMLAAGLPPVMANASNAVAVTPGHMIAAIADRERIPPADRRIVALVLAALLAGAIGAVLLLITPARLFTLLVPLLIGTATLVFAFAPQLQSRFAAWGRGSAHHAGTPATAALIGLTSIYGGYFGAGLGVMMIAVLSVTGMSDIRAANALKNLMATAVSAATIAIFVIQDVVSWPETLVMLAGAASGGFLGGHLVRVLPPSTARRIVIAVGAAMTAIYAYRYWM
jgi:uncharacterized membrane protein YfcA